MKNVAHAEHEALLNAVKGDVLVVARILKNGKLSCAKPCSNCMERMKQNGIKKVFYSDWDQEIKVLYI